uniref:Polyprotein n=1 Tax=Rodentolepis nana TaxID=102285 RepID=A0A0R3U0Y5_RODNA
LTARSARETMLLANTLALADYVAPEGDSNVFRSSSGMLKECHLDPPVECWRDVTGQKGPSTAVSVDTGQKDPSPENPTNQ